MTCILYNTLCSLNFLHTANMMHRDIKPANILIEPDCQIRLCDFGLSRPVPDTLIQPKLHTEQQEQIHVLPLAGHSRYNTQSFHENFAASPSSADVQSKIEKMRLKRRIIYQTPGRISSKVSGGLHLSNSPMNNDEEFNARSNSISKNLFDRKPVLKTRTSSVSPLDGTDRKARKDFLATQLVKQRKSRKAQ